MPMGIEERITDRMRAGSFDLQVEVLVCESDAQLTEGLIWDELAGRRLWVDTTAGTASAPTIGTGERKRWELRREGGATFRCRLGTVGRPGYRYAC